MEAVTGRISRKMPGMIPMLFFPFFYLYVLLVIRPELIYQKQQPFFYTGKEFFIRYYNYPGGLTEYLSAFLSQFYYYPATGAFIITLTAFTVCISVRYILRGLGAPPGLQILQFVPGVILIILHSSYLYNLSFSLGPVFALLLFGLFLAVTRKSGPFIKGGVFVSFALVLYYITAGPFFLFVLLCLCHELYTWRNIHLWALYIVSGTALPFISAYLFFPVSVNDAFFLLLRGSEYIRQEAVYGFYAFFPLIYMAMGASRLASVKKSRPVKLILEAGGWRAITTQTVAMVLAGAAAAFPLREKAHREYCELDYHSRNREWGKVLETARNSAVSSRYNIFRINRALYHQGILLDSMFSFGQRWGSEGLMLISPEMQFDLGKITQNAYLISEICWDMAYVNGAEQWSHEVVTFQGEAPWEIKRLALVNLAKGEMKAAEKFILLLKKNLLFREWAIKYGRYLEEPSLLNNDREFVGIRSRMGEKDFIFTYDVKILLEAIFNNRNKMVFEYLMACRLLEKDLLLHARSLIYFEELGYSNLPRHSQEALLLFEVIHKNIRLPPHNFRVRPDVVLQFKNFGAVFLGKYNSDLKKAKKDLLKDFKDTYWFYYFYGPDPKRKDG